MDGIKNLIFDFGGVLINLDRNACRMAFEQLGIESIHESVLDDYRQKELFMELSNYQAFMECMRKWEKIGCNILCGLALWEQMQDCDRRGVPYTDIDIEAVSQDVAYRLMMSHDRLYALALYEWTEQHFAQNSDTSDAAAGENGCNFPTHNNST